MSESDAARCLACRAPISGAYCAACGQRTDTARLQLIPFARSSISNLLDVNRGYLYTFIHLLTEPGPRIRAYLLGDRTRMVHPARYFTLGLTLLLVLGSLLGADTPITFYENVMLKLVARLQLPGVTAALQFTFTQLDVLFFLSLVGIYSSMFALSIRLDRDIHLNLAEVIVFLLFSGGQFIYLLLPFVVVGTLWPTGQTVLNVLIVPLFVAFQAYTSVGIFSTKPRRAIAMITEANVRVLLFLPIIIGLLPLVVYLGEQTEGKTNWRGMGLLILFMIAMMYGLYRLAIWVGSSVQEKRLRKQNLALKQKLTQRLGDCDPALKPYLHQAIEQLDAGKKPTALHALRELTRAKSRTSV
jgi:hypothetical protein